ncbi:hypothetical protein ACFL3T_00340 [Patescibacteria group bacterium]
MKKQTYYKFFKELAIGIPIALITMLITFTFLYQADEEFQRSQSSIGKGGNYTCHPLEPKFCKSETKRYECCTDIEFINQYWTELAELPTKNGPDFWLVIFLGIGSAVVFNLIIDYFHEKSNSL